MPDRHIQEFPPHNRIRVETALSRFPVHRLVKKGTIAIDLQRSANGVQSDFRWKVSYNSDFGQPGPLAYKIDTLIVNRRIDESPRPLPEVIRLGSLREICRDAGITDHNTEMVKMALHQNASAYITAKFTYKAKNGREKRAEIGYTRYSVIFTGETLPDSSTADAVYIVINPSYRDMLNHVEVRPLDYNYLLQLPPGPQRLYELLSFQIYGAIASGRPRAKMLYSDYCRYAPQTRYPDFEHLKKQMYKVHLPHRESGYITKVDYEKTIDADSEPDWEIFYTPGPKALAEYRAFSNRSAGVPLTQHNEVRRTLTRSKACPAQASLDLSEANPVAAELLKRGISEKMASDLLAKIRPGQDVFDQIDYFDHVKASDVRGKLVSPTGFLVSLIRDNAPVPADFQTNGRRQQQEAEKASDAELRARYEAYRKEKVQLYMDQLPAAKREVLLHEHTLLFEGMPHPQRCDLIEFSLFTALVESGALHVTPFEQWKQHKNVATHIEGS
jgi:hypothetical protein